MTRARSAALAATLGVAVACWVVVVRSMSGMDMGVATRLGPFGGFAVLWVAMTAAMMLPGAVGAVMRRADAGIGPAVGFVGGYLAVWAAVGVAVYVLYRPHGYVTAGIAAIVAGVYEFTPLKKHFRASCRSGDRSGVAYGAHCVGSGIGLTLMLVAFGVMSLGWMLAVGALMCAQKLRPADASVDVPVGLALIALGALILAAPAAIPGFMPAM